MAKSADERTASSADGEVQTQVLPALPFLSSALPPSLLLASLVL